VVTELSANRAPSSPDLHDAVADDLGPTVPGEGTRSRLDSAMEAAVDLTMLLALPALFLLAMVALVMPL
jgi:hypothetical protein